MCHCAALHHATLPPAPPCVVLLVPSPPTPAVTCPALPCPALPCPALPDTFPISQGFHWANPGLEIAGPWAQNEQRYTHTIRAKTLDNMSITIEAECWVQMVNPKMYVRVAGKEMLPQTFVEDKLTAKVKQHVAAINALQLRSVEATASPAAGAEDADNDFEYLGDPGPLVPVQGEPLPSAAAGEAQAQAKEDDVDNIIVTKPEDSPTEFQVFPSVRDGFGRTITGPRNLTLSCKADNFLLNTETTPEVPTITFTQPLWHSPYEDSWNRGPEHTWSLGLWGTRKSRQAEPQPTGAPPPRGYTANTIKPLTFGEKFWRYTADLLKLQEDRVLREKRRKTWTGDYLDGGTRMYLLGPDRVYLVQLVAGCVWVPEGRVWAPEMFIVGEGIHFIVDDPVGLMAQPNRANSIAAELGMKIYGH